MKKIVLITMLVGCISITACQNDGTETIVSEIPSDFIPEDSLFKIGNLPYGEWMNYSNFFYNHKTRTSFTQETVYGYTSYTSTGNRTTILRSSVLDELGIPHKYYIVNIYTLEYKLVIPGLNATTYFSPQDSPNCGMKPSIISYIGYDNTQMADTIKMVTKVEHIISDLNGINYNLWYPRNLNDVEWNYIKIDQ